MRHSLTRELPWSPEQLFDLVADVERYPDFVPWIYSLTVRDRRPLAVGIEELAADAQVRFAIVRERFSTWVRLDREARAIDVALIVGPFRHLSNRWTFVSAAGGARLTFDIEFEFRSRLLTALLAANFSHAVDRLIGCFEERASALYGRAAA